LNLSKALAFLIVFLIGLALITPGFISYSHTMYTRWLEFDSLPDDSLDVVYVGNSHALNTFQPRVIDNLLGIHSYTAGTTSSGAQIVYHQVREVLESQSPDVIVFETLPLEVDETSLAFRMFGFLLPLHGVPALEATVDMFDPTEYQYVAIPLMYFHTGWQDGPLALVKRGVIAYVYEALSLLRVDSNALIHALGIDEGETSTNRAGCCCGSPSRRGTSTRKRPGGRSRRRTRPTSSGSWPCASPPESRCCRDSGPRPGHAGHRNSADGRVHGGPPPRFPRPERTGFQTDSLQRHAPPQHLRRHAGLGPYRRTALQSTWHPHQ
jgi:hypothetical protein